MTTIQTAALAPLKVYIAGKIAGDPQYRRKFLAAHMELKNEGAHRPQPGAPSRRDEERGLHAHMPRNDRQRRHGGVPAGLGGFAGGKAGARLLRVRWEKAVSCCRRL